MNDKLSTHLKDALLDEMAELKFDRHELHNLQRALYERVEYFIEGYEDAEQQAWRGEN